MGPAPSCPDITYQLGPCISYLLQIEVAPPPACCDGVKYLSQYSSDKEDREAICWCIKGAASMMGLTDFPLISALPNTCGVSVKLPPISSEIDCSQELVIHRQTYRYTSMAYWRSLSTRASFTARRRQNHPSITHILQDDDRKHDVVSEQASSPNLNHFLSQKRFFGNNLSRISGFGGFAQDRRISNALLSSGSGFACSRHMSTAIGGGSDKVELLSDVSGVVSDATMEAVASQVSAMSEIAIATADSWLPVKALQYLIGSVHTYTGLNWWAAIAITTLLIRTATVPILINQLKAMSKLALMKPQLEEYRQEMQDKGMGREAVAEFQKKTGKLYKEYGVHPLSAMKGIFVQAPVFISFFLAISNMAEKVPSFKSGGAYWFLDLTTPDSMYIFPVLAALTFLLTVECNLQEGMEGNPAAGTMKNVSRGLAVLTVPFTMSFPKAVFCYWVTSNMFSLGYGLVLKYSGLKKALGIPQLPSTPPSQRSQPAFSLLSTLKQVAAVTQDTTSSPVEQSKVQDGRTSSSSVLSQRIKTLEKQVKGRKRNKKR
ncbi:unnamed protein product [Prunus armeniaca]|uniref:Non-specific lipid-transfer protein n=1 Tax=Prunus armeniaca TaxID=36596 RepID=A0A6J5UW36_PRUAR|nr:unnamed protein product [Prunus armeniaca]